MDNKISIILDYIKNKIYYRVKKSDIHGVGLFAIKDIPKGTDIQEEPPSCWNESESILESEFKDAGENFIKLLDDYFICVDNYYEIYFPSHYKWMHFFYMNHSENPNYDYLTNKTIKDIKEGEEITGNYEDSDRTWGKYIKDKNK